MKTKIGMFAGAAGVMLLATHAMAVLDPNSPPVGNLELKLTDAGNFYNNDTLAPLPRAPLTGPGAGLGIPAVGDEDFTAYQLTSFSVDSGPNTLTTPFRYTGVLSFLDVSSVNGPLPFGGNTIVNVGLDDSDRAHTTAGGGAGRFFLFASSDPNAADFSVGPGAVDFSTGIADNLVTSNGSDFFTVDHLDGFTRDGLGNDYTLILTGSVLADGDGDIDQDLSTSGVAATDPRYTFSSGGIGTHNLVADGGLWFDKGIVGASGFTFQINLVTFSGVGDAGHPVGTTPPGVRDDIYQGGWQAQSQDPVHVTLNPIPEPVTAGLGAMSLMGLAGYMTRRRNA